MIDWIIWQGAAAIILWPLAALAAPLVLRAIHPKHK